VAAEITVAFENVRLRVHELSTLYDITETLHSRLDLSGMMKRILARTVEASRADAGLVLLRETDGTLSPAAVAGDWQGLERLPLVESLAAGALASVLCAPMLADAGAIGVIVLGSRRAEAFLYPQVRLVSIIAGQAALLAENARLYSQLEHQAVLAERGRLAREMHDGLAQTLGYLKLRAGQIAGWVLSGQTEQAGTALQELAQTADDAYLDLRTALDGLRVALDHPQPGDFGEELRRLAADFQRLSGVPVELSVEAEPDLSPARQAHLRSIVQESLANVRKHAQACRVRLQLAQTAGRAVLLIEDNGRGFEAGQEWPATRHGLRVMQERAALLGADLQVSTSPGAGTRVTLEWPAAALAAR
jgi:nitrate/nitrite-specific signal transduction histidine kinase